MSKQIPEIRLIKFEGPSAFVQCQLFLDDQKLENFDPTLPSTYYPLDSDGNYLLEVETLTQNFYFSFTSKNFNEEGMNWHTLSGPTNKEQDGKNKEAEPQILILCKKREGEFNQITESFEFMPQLSLFGGTVDDSVYSEKNPEPEKEKDENLEINAAIYLQSDMSIEHSRNFQVIEVLNNKSQELNHALQEINNLKSQIHRLEAENLSLKTAGLFYHPSQHLLNEINTQKQVLKENAEIKKQLKSSSANSKALFLALSKECLKLGIPVPEKDKEAVFTINKTKLNLFLDSNQLFYRNGNTVKPFEAFHKPKSNSNFNLLAVFDSASTKPSKFSTHSTPKCSK